MSTYGLTKTIPELVAQATTAHKQGNAVEAAQIYQQVLSEDPTNMNALHLYGVLALQSGQAKLAIDSIEKALAVDASRAPVHFNLGNAYLQDGNGSKAAAAYRRAIAINVGMAAAHRGLAGALTQLRDYDGAIAAAQQALLLEPESVAAYSSLATAQHRARLLQEALQNYQRALQLSPQDPVLLNQTGYCQYELGEFEEAATLCRQATTLAPEYGLAYFNLGLALLDSGRLEAAVKSLRRANELMPGTSLGANALGRALLLSNQYLAALAEFTRAAELVPDHESAHNNRGLVLQRLNRIEEAAAAFEQALACSPGYRDAWLNLATLQEQSNQLDAAAQTLARGEIALPGDPALLLIRARLEQRNDDLQTAMSTLAGVSENDLDAGLQQRLLFERGRLADRLQLTEQAFGCFTQANDSARQSAAGRYYQHRDYLQNVQALAHSSGQQWAQDWQLNAPPAEQDSPVFLLGFPRSGTTLLEQILGAHSALAAMEEQSIIAQVGASTGLEGEDYLLQLGQLPAGRLQQLREQYFELAGEHTNRQRGQRLLDKFPLNTIHLPLIHALFPRAKLLLALRHPCDVALSCFMQEFELNDAMVHFTSLTETAEFYQAVMSICANSRQQLDLQIQEVRYEELVADLEPQVRQLVNFLGLEWEPGILDFVATAAEKSRIGTPSYAQVSRPLYEEASLRWLRYRQQLAPIAEILRPQCEALGYSSSPTEEDQAGL